MAKNIKGITIEIDGSAKGLDKALGDVNKKSRDLQKELRDVERLLKFNPGNTELLAQKQKLLADQVEATRDKLTKLKDAQKQVQEQFEKGEIGEEQYRAFQREIIETESKLKHFEGQLDTSKSKLEEFGEKMGESGEKMKSAGEKMTNAGKEMSMKVTAPIVAVGAASLVAFGEVDEALDTIITKTGATGDAIGKFEEAFKNVASRTPHDIQSVGEAIGEVNTQFGFMGKELETNSELMLAFSAINGQDVTSSAIDAKRAIEAYGMSNQDLQYVLDGVTKTAQDTGQSTQDLFDKATKGAPQIKALGLSFVEGVALMGNFEKSGVDSATALSYLSRAQVTFAKDGKTLQQGLEETITKIKGAKSETDAMTIAAEVFGTKGATRMVDAIQRGTLSIDDFVAAGEGIEGTVIKTFEDTLDPIDQAAIASNNAKLALAEVGGAVQVALLPFMETLTNILKSVAEWFSNLSPAAQQMIIVIAGIVAAIGPLLVIIGTLASSIGSIMTVVPKLIPIFKAAGLAITGISAPVALAIAAVVALIAIGVALWKNWDTVKANALKLWESFKTNFSGIYQAVSAYMTMAKNILLAVWSYIKGTFQNSLAFIKALVTGDFKGMKDAIKNQMENAKKLITTIWESVKTFLENIDLKQIGKDIIQGLINGVTAMAGKVLESVTGVVDGAINKAKKLLGIKSPSRVFMQIGEYTGEGLVKGMDATANQVQQASDRMAGLMIPRVPKLDSPGLSASGSSSSVANSFNFARMLEGAQFIVREEADIEKIAKKLNDYIRMSARGKGVVM